MSVQASNILVMCNMVTPEEISDDAEYADILADVNEECAKYGAVRRVHIPRPQDLARGACEAADVGQVFVEFLAVESAQVANAAVSGRRFSGRTIQCSYMSPENWLTKQKLFDSGNR